MISGVVLAAGASSRMGRAKAALPVGSAGDTIVARVVRTLLTAGIPEVVVVAGAHIDAVRRAMPPDEPRARVIEHLEWQRGQLSSLLAGLDAVDNPQLEAVMVMVVDVPLVSAETVSKVIAAWRASRAPIVRPADASTPAASGQQRHGHPVIFDRAVFAALRSADPNVGAKAVFAAHRARIVNVAVDDPGAFEDVDTPEDYERMSARIK